VSVQVRNPKGVPAPMSDYSQVAIVSAGDRMMFISGQVALDENGGLVGPGDAVKQAEQILENIRRILEDSGGKVSDLVSLTWYFTNMDDRLRILDLRKRFLAGHAPASTGVEVSRLASADWLVEVDCVAAISTNAGKVDAR
jgi:enamine deaminase RidA (YjgF/YER057c/UK114 family)